MSIVAALALTTATGAAATAAAASVRADNTIPLYGLVDAAAQRLQTADPVAAYKWATGTAIEDPPRVQQVLAAVTGDATANHVDPGYVRRVFQDQINATESVEYTRFAQWKLNPQGAPGAAPELSASRTAIDALNRRMVTEITGHWDVLHSPACATDVDDADDAVIHARQLDTVYQQALAFATRSYCG